MKNAVVLLSGGLDSTTVMGIATDMGFSVLPLTVFYGQRNDVELIAAKNVAAHFRAPHKIIELDLRIFGGSSLTADIAVLSHENNPLNSIPNTYVPARNTIMLSLALAYAEVNQAFDIFFGANIHDYSGYPDCRPVYIEAFEAMANLATKSAYEQEKKITIHAPLVNLKKSEIIQRGMELDVPYGLSHSCYNPKESLACGECSACFYRKKGFLDANVADPTNYFIRR